MYNVFRFASVVIPRLPRWFVLFLADLIGLVTWLVASKARKQATANIIHVRGTKVLATRAGPRRLRRTVQQMFQNNVRNYLDMFSLPYTQPETILSRTHIEGVEHLEAALSLGKGVIIFSAHLGPFNYLAQWISIKGYKITIPVERLKDQRMLDLMLKLRSSKGVQFVPLGGSAPMRTIIKALRNKQIVLITRL